MTVVLSVLLALAAGGAACVVWADRGGPPWVRGAARVTLALGSVALAAARSRRRGLGGGPSRNGDDGGGDD
ncbi:hypothetical protein [Streptomyces sp. NPDC058157]|uniref:hypothetical protein n=1 Tax=Streptomyces sp. NPDC058157 TaxID=3346360 RepID=UPI0036E43F79